MLTRVVAGLGLAASVVLAVPHSPDGQQIRERLTPSGADRHARGRAVLTLLGGEARFDVIVQHLHRHARFEVLVDAIKVAILFTKSSGHGRVRFASQPHGREALLGFDPRGATITIRNAAGRDVLSGSFPAPDDNADAVACCLPSDTGADCEDRTADECSAQGGTINTAPSCLPNPCVNDLPGGNDVVCCLPNLTDVACDDLSLGDCLAQGGTAIEASSCTPNPCTPLSPPPDNDVQCCLPDGEGAFDCDNLTQAKCAAQNGIDKGPGDCVPDPCSD